MSKSLPCLEWSSVRGGEASSELELGLCNMGLGGSEKCQQLVLSGMYLLAPDLNLQGEGPAVLTGHTSPK